MFEWLCAFQNLIVGNGSTQLTIEKHIKFSVLDIDPLQ